MVFALSEVYPCEPDEEVLKLVEEFAEMVRWWAERARGFQGKDYTALRRAFYADWVKRWPEANRQLIHTSASVAASRVKLQRSAEERPKSPDVEVSYAVLHPKMLKVVGGRLRVSLARGEYAYVHLKPKNDYQQRLLRQAEDGLWRLGQAVLTKSWVLLTFTSYELDEMAFQAVQELLVDRRFS